MPPSVISGSSVVAIGLSSESLYTKTFSTSFNCVPSGTCDLGSRMLSEPSPAGVLR